MNTTIVVMFLHLLLLLLLLLHHQVLIHHFVRVQILVHAPLDARSLAHGHFTIIVTLHTLKDRPSVSHALLA